jgi:hypothetical protein
MRQNMLPILEAGGVDLVLSGHSHSYERSYLLDGHYGLSTTLSAGNFVDGGSGQDPNPYEKPAGLGSNQGAVYAVAGSSGQISGGTLNHPAMYISLNVLGSVVLDFTTNRLDLQFLDSTGVVRDTCAIVKGSSSSSPPAAPGNLTAVPGNNRVDLAWSASAGATSYNVKRSTENGGPYAPLASGVVETAYNDPTAANGTTYYYVVSAVNAFGEGPNSTQVAATPAAPTAPNPPTSLRARAAGKRKINLTWTQSTSSGVVSNRIYRSINNGQAQAIATIPVTTSQQHGPDQWHGLFYWVTAINGSGLEALPPIRPPLRHDECRGGLPILPAEG